MTETIYTPESGLRHPIQLLCEMARDLFASRDLAWRILVRDINAQYRQSFLGILWAFVPAVAMAAGITLASRSNVLNIGATPFTLPAYVAFNMTLWQTFVEALLGPIQAVTNARAMLVKVNFPRESIILSKLGEVVFNFLIKMVLIVALFLWFHIPITKAAFLAPFALMSLIMLGTAIGLLLCPLGGLYQDISKGVTLFSGVWLFLTPVLYDRPTGNNWKSLIVNYNPVTSLLVTTRELATTGIVSQPATFWLMSTLSLIGLLLAWIIYRLAMPFVVERMGS